MSRDYRLLHVDVFTDRPLSGNPLAVVLGARDIADDEMLAVAREMNLSETTFVLPATRGDCVARVRIFTPGRELPFAGHPTVGTAWVLATLGLTGGKTRFALEEGIGPVEVELEGDPARPSFVWMRHRDATFGDEVKDRAGVAAALGLTERDLVAGAPIQTGSTGNAFLYVPLRDAATVDRAALDQRRLEQALPEMTTLGVFVLAPTRIRPRGACTRGCSHRRTAWSRIPRRARPAARSARTSRSTGSSLSRPGCASSASRARRWDTRASCT